MLLLYQLKEDESTYLSRQILLSQAAVCYWGGGAYSVGSEICINNNAQKMVCLGDGTWLTLNNYEGPDGFECR